MGRGSKGLIAIGAVLAALACASPATAAPITSVFDGTVSCADQGAENGHLRFCGGSDTTVPTFDEVPIDVNVALPAESASGPDGPYPMVMMFHGWGGSKLDFQAMKRFAGRGYAVFSMSDRGWGDSCGGLSPSRLTPTCLLKGYIRLMDTRYEVRDAQYFAGLLADEGVVEPQKIAATGGSYGGGLSMSLAALRDRVMMPDDSLVPWQSPDGKPMRIAVAVPEIPWTDLGSALVPNGATLDYVADAPYLGPNGDRRIGVLKFSFVAGLYALGLTTGNFALPGIDPDADVTRWFAELNAGEPYDQNPLTPDLVEEASTHHSSYGIDHSQPPAPLLISNGWTDDLFPPDEAIRFYNRTRTQYPDADISLYFLDYGHQRGQNKSADIERLRDEQDPWFDYYLKGEGSKPTQGVHALTTSCPSSAPSAGPFFAPTWAKIAPGEIRFSSAASKTILPLNGDLLGGTTFDPIATNDACATASAEDQSGAASYRLDPVPAGQSFTLLGSPTVIADIASAGPTSQIAARLLDVDPSTGQERLVARGLWRPEVTSAAKRQVFQLHPDAYEFAAGHVVKLELLPQDTPYGRISNGQLTVDVSNLELRLPVREQPGALDGLVEQPAPKRIPPGYALARGYEPDSDGDGVIDDEDECVDVPASTPNGCPPPPPPVLKCDGGAEGTADDDELTGSAARDRIRGLEGDDLIRGKAGADCLAGDEDDDELRAGDGHDVLYGLSGDDTIFAVGHGRDEIHCGSGVDRVHAGRNDAVGSSCERVSRGS